MGISVADARVDENKDAALAFAVTLTRAASGTLTVDYATANGSATAGDDYTAASGTLTFGSGESSRTIEVAVLDDSHDEGEETLTLTLSNASGGRVTDGEATGTIVNRDPLPRALLGAVRAHGGRAGGGAGRGTHGGAAPAGVPGEVAGHELRRGMVGTTNLPFKRWDTVFPNASCAVALIDRQPKDALHYAEFRIGLCETAQTRFRTSAHSLIVVVGTQVADVSCAYST